MTLVVADSLGCVHKYVQYPYIVISSTIQLYNVFSPNDDGVNDVFSFDYDGYETMNWTLYDRWGTQIFTNNGDSNLSWDGTLGNGAQASEGVYYYVLKIGQKTYSGNVTLMR